MELVILQSDLYREHSENERDVAVILDVTDYNLETLNAPMLDHPILVGVFEEVMYARCFIEAAEKARAIWFDLTDEVANDESIEEELESAKKGFLEDKGDPPGSHEEGWEWAINQLEY